MSSPTNGHQIPRRASLLSSSLGSAHHTTAPRKAPNKKREIPWKEVREWLNIIGILLIPLLIGIYTIANNIQQTSLQLDQQRETTLKTYEDDIVSLLLDRHLATSQPGDEVRTAALAKTLVH